MEFPDLDDDNANQWFDFVLTLAGPAIEGRAVQPYAGGVFRVRVQFTDTFSAGAPPRITFMNRIWHPFVQTAGAAEGQMCHEFWEVRGPAPQKKRCVRPLGASFSPRRLAHAPAAPQEFYRQRAPAAPTVRSFLATLRSLLADVHIIVGGAVAVNEAAMAELQRDGGAPFDAAARAITVRYATEAAT